MKIRNDSPPEELVPSLKDLLAEIRRERNFNPTDIVEAKVALLGDYMSKAGLSACVIATSGGIDSAVVLALAANLKSRPGSPLKRVEAILLPVSGTPGATNQDAATERGVVLCKALGITPRTIELGPIHKALADTVDREMAASGGPWAVGQLVSYLRTPTLYYTTALLSQEGYPSVVLGTTNRDEGGYLGYFGKASDGLVDLQLISDLHKSEVYALASELNLPDEIVNATPTGDMFDACTDEDVFGATYDFVELYQTVLCWPSHERERRLGRLSPEGLQQFERLAQRLEAMHVYNGHKYIGRSPAVHLDVIDAAVPGGWNNGPAPLPDPRSDAKPPVNLFKMSLPAVRPEDANPVAFPNHWGPATVLSYVLTHNEIADILSQASTTDWVRANTQGYADGTKPERGSSRASAFSEPLAELLWTRLRPLIAPVMVLDTDAATEHGGHRIWRPVGVSSLMRFIRYGQGDSLLPHYDAPFVFSDRRRTLKSLVITLAQATGGDIGFINDPWLTERKRVQDWVDWKHPAHLGAVKTRLRLSPGQAVLFDHRILHDSSEVAAGEKIIIRTDIVYERADWWLR